uniref:Glutaredoxin domain-containing protein n=1 Tax=Zea mays TaxID=4577 RepID=B4FNY4_MAIZE|nr:unknown [Zea mays]
MGCTGSRHALRGGVRSPHAWGRSRSGRAHHTVALKSSSRDKSLLVWDLTNPVHSTPESGATADYGGDEVCVRKREIQRFPGIVRARVSAFQQRIDAKLAKLAPPPPAVPPPPDSARKVVVYLTSLRGVRKTYEDCWSTRSVLQSYGVRVDERDLSMHAGFKDELHAALGSSAGRLPQVFADGRHLGGAEEIRRMHEAGELSEALEACEMAPPPSCPGGKGVALEACSGCGGVRFVPCEECSGSCKVFVEEAGTFRRCPECNENGLVRCPLCSL